MAFPYRCLVTRKRLGDYFTLCHGPKDGLLSGPLGWRVSRNFLSLARKLETERNMNRRSAFEGEKRMFRSRFFVRSAVPQDT